MDALRCEREAERGNRGEGYLPKYKLEVIMQLLCLKDYYGAKGLCRFTRDKIYNAAEDNSSWIVMDNEGKGRSLNKCKRNYRYFKEVKVDIPTPKKDVLGVADRVINGERQDNYGSPEASFTLIAEYWSTYLRELFRQYHGIVNLEPIDVANMMIAFKLARTQGQKTSKDTYVDIAGYAAIAGDRMMEVPSERQEEV